MENNLHKHKNTNLNERQKKAVHLENSNCFVLAGAGSGKTTVISHRIAHLIQKNPDQGIIAITFTVKAAKEMKSRVEDIIGENSNLFVGTFHSFAHTVLRKHIAYIGKKNDFIVIDDKAQEKIITNVLAKKMDVSSSASSEKSPEFASNVMRIGKMISVLKNEGIKPSDVMQMDLPVYYKQYNWAYKEYEKAMVEKNSLDYDDLILYLYEVFKVEEVRTYYLQKYQHVLVDEVQDINYLQREWILFFADNDHHIMIVGDDDQSIYGWRGAKISHLQNLFKRVPNMHIIKLEQNYRSTRNILDAANCVIMHNEERMEKTLFSSYEEGEKINIYKCGDKFHEALVITNKIKHLVKHGEKPGEIAVLYRINALSRIIESTFRQEDIPYNIIGGLSFFDRKEIKDVMAYLRLILDLDCDEAFTRIYNVPKRKLGNKAFSEIQSIAACKNISLWEASMMEGLSPSTMVPLQAFTKMILSMRAFIDKIPNQSLIKLVLKESGLLDFYSSEKHRDDEQRLENLEELMKAAEESKNSSLREFINEMVISQDSNKKIINGVHLLTVHAAKGLEFPNVFIIGMDDELFPYVRKTKVDMSEERRLFYVAITRAMRTLSISYCTQRDDKRGRQSDFLSEIPNRLLSYK